MIGDKIVAKPYHIKAAGQIFDILKDTIAGMRTTITIAGESGGGKSEIASELAKCFESAGIKTAILQQDDYFYYPPKSNHQQREKDINHVGTGEVKIELLNEHLKLFKHSPDQSISKPLVIFEEDRITEEIFNPGDYTIVIAEGTYTTVLKNADHHVFIDRDYKDTREDRIGRQRDVIDEFSNRVLEIEHEIISKHKSLATIIVGKDYSVTIPAP